nr:DUF3564 family protein [Mycetohabitans endofungorum]
MPRATCFKAHIPTRSCCAVAICAFSNAAKRHARRGATEAAALSRRLPGGYTASPVTVEVGRVNTRSGEPVDGRWHLQAVEREVEPAEHSEFRH